jgi:hypothetical protein
MSQPLIESASRQAVNTQIVGNMGLYLVCYELSKLGWNVMPTARNARGVDIIAYNATATRFLGIQVKSLSKRNPVPLGPTLDKVMGDFWFIVNNLAGTPGIYILKPQEVRERAHRGVKEDRISYWLQPKTYMTQEFENSWTRLDEPNPPQ